MEYKLKDIIQFKPGYPFKKEDMTEVGIDLIKIGNLKNNRVIIPSDVKIKENIKFKDYVIKKNDILMALTGDPVFKGNIQTWVGRTSIYVEDKISYLNQRICKLIPNEKILINDYLYYWLIRFDKTYEIAGLFRGSANQANISHKEVGEMLIDVPSLTIQRKVSKVLSNIDNKIDLNNKINKNLQAMASNVINSYFDKCDDREKYNGIIKFIKGKKPKDVIDYYEVGYEKYLTIACLNGEENKYANIDNMFMTDHDILMVMDGASSGDTYFSTYGIVGSTLSKIEIINNNYIPEYLFFTLKKYKNDIQRQTTGTAIPHTNKNIVLNLEIPKINMNDQLWFKSILYKILQNNEENRNLSQLRDTLLPKLMNGEIDLSKVEL